MANKTESTGLANLTRMIIHPDLKGKKIRKCWEVSSPTVQCNGTIGPFKKGTECYICGMVITKTLNGLAEDKDNNNESNTKSKDGRNPECEHILPIASAIIWLGLASPQFITSSWYLGQEELKKEYAWAHRTCNQIKSDELFIEQDKDGKFIVKTKELKEFLIKIWRTKRVDSITTFRPELHDKYKTETDFINERIGDGRGGPLIKPFHNICNYLNRFQAPNLLLLSGVCSLVNINGPKANWARNLQANASPNTFKELQEKKIAAKRGDKEKQYNVIFESVKVKVKPNIKSFMYDDIIERLENFKDEQKEALIDISFELPDEEQGAWNEYVDKLFIAKVIELYRTKLESNKVAFPRGYSLLEKIPQQKVLPSKLGNIVARRAAATATAAPPPPNNGRAEGENTEMFNGPSAAAAPSGAMNFNTTNYTAVELLRGFPAFGVSQGFPRAKKATPAKKAAKKATPAKKGKRKTPMASTLNIRNLSNKVFRTYFGQKMSNNNNNNHPKNSPKPTKRMRPSGSNEGGRRRTRKIRRN